MTRRKKTKSTQEQPVTSEVAKCATTTATTTSIVTPKPKVAPASSTIKSHTRGPPSSNQNREYSPNVLSTAYLSRSSTASSISVEDASASSQESNDKKLAKPKPKRAVKTIVKYVTKQIHVYPMHPILTVERLPNLEYHVSVLTEAVGRRPSVYQHGKGVRFVPHSNEEYKTIQRYLARIESAERISWCVHSLPPGNSLKVSIKVREVEYVKINDDLAKLSIQNNSKPGNDNSKDIKLNHKDNSPRKGNLPCMDTLSEIDKSSKDTQPKDLQASVQDSKEKDNNTPPRKDRRANAAKKEIEVKKPKDVRQNRSYNRSYKI